MCTNCIVFHSIKFTIRNGTYVWFCTFRDVLNVIVIMFVITCHILRVTSIVSGLMVLLGYINIHFKRKHKRIIHIIILSNNLLVGHASILTFCWFSKIVLKWPWLEYSTHSYIFPNNSRRIQLHFMLRNVNGGLLTNILITKEIICFLYCFSSLIIIIIVIPTFLASV